QAKTQLEAALRAFPISPQVLKAAQRVRAKRTATTGPLTTRIAEVHALLDGGKTDEARARAQTLGKENPNSRAVQFLELELGAVTPARRARAQGLTCWRHGVESPCSTSRTLAGPTRSTSCSSESAATSWEPSSAPVWVSCSFNVRCHFVPRRTSFPVMMRSAP